MLSKRALALALMTTALSSTLVSAAHAEKLPLPSRGDVPESKTFDYGVMGPPATADIVAAADKAVAMPMPAGPFQPTWTSIQANYKEPAWFQDAKFGIFMHWGVYSVGAHHNEWYEKHMYNGADAKWHAEHFGPQEKVGYKDLIPQFTAANWDPDAWAVLFKKSGAKWVTPTAEHHDNFALWDSQVTPFNAVKMGPHRDLIGDLAKAVRKQGLKFGVTNHGMENFTFVNPDAGIDAREKALGVDLYDPAWAKFYNYADRSPAAQQAFLTDWVNRNIELIDKYHPDILWWDNGVNLRVLDPLKRHIAAYYYNRAREWGQEVSISTKFVAMAPSNDDTRQIGSIIDFENVGTRSPKGIRPGPWQVDDTIGRGSWGYVDGLKAYPPEAMIAKLVDTVSKGGNFLLNISPMADGTIPQDQQDTLLGIGKWLDTNGEAIYATRPWTTYGEGDMADGKQNIAKGVRFTTKGGALYVIDLNASPDEVVVASLAKGKVQGKIKAVTMLGAGPVAFTQSADGLHIKLPATKPAESAWAFKVTGLKVK
jgi:alpha-L-fucosidase